MLFSTERDDYWWWLMQNGDVNTARLMLAALALMAGAILVNLAPPNPYSAAALAVWRQGHFLNFNGLTRLVATLWPFLTLPFLLLTSRRP